MERFCAFVEDQASESLEIPRIPTVYCNDAFLRARKRLSSHVNLSKRALGIKRRSRSPLTSMELIAAREAAEVVQEEVEEGRKRSSYYEKIQTSG